jgi:hypothetical protein
MEKRLCGGAFLCHHEKSMRNVAGLWKGGWGNANFALEDFSTRGMPHTMEPDEEAHPAAVGFPGAWAITPYAYGGLFPVHQFRRPAMHVHVAFFVSCLCAQYYWFGQNAQAREFCLGYRAIINIFEINELGEERNAG